MDTSTSLGYWLRRRRKALDLTQLELAQRVGCVVTTIKKIEADERRPSKQLAERLADCLVIPPEARAAFLQVARAELVPDLLAVATQPLTQPTEATARSQPTASLPTGTVTFLFTDIEESTRHWEQQTAAMATALARHDALLRAVIEAHGGTVVKSTGDGLLAVFVIAANGMTAALAAQHMLAAEPWGETGPIRVRMALHTGVAELRAGDYYGPQLNRTARLLAAGHGGQILLSAAAWELTRDHLPPEVELRDLGVHRLKDLTRPEQIFQLTTPDLPAAFPPLKTLEVWPTKAQLSQPTDPVSEEQTVGVPDSRKDETPEGELGIFVGRTSALAQLSGFLDTVLAGHGQVVFVTGEAGSGKTTLVQEFARRAHAAHAELVIAGGNCNAHTGTGDPYLPFREVLGLLTGTLDATQAGGLLSHVHASDLRAFLSYTLPVLMDAGPNLIDTFVPGGALAARAAGQGTVDWVAELERLVGRKTNSTGSTPDITQQQMFEQYTNVLRSLAAQRPLLLILDDLQWADAASISLLFHLGRRVAGSRILLVGTYRPDEVALGRGGERHPLELAVNELRRYGGDIWADLDRTTADEGRQFVDALLDSAPNRLGPDFRAALYQQTGGHPLFTVELLRGLQSRGDLIQDEQGFWVVGSGLDWETLPARVEGVIAERIGRLDEALREALAIASVEGEVFTAEVVARTQNVDVRGLVRRLSGELDRQHRLVLSQSTGRMGEHRLSTYRFRHILFQKYLYARLSEGERAYLHEDVGTALELLAAGQTETIAAQLARHFEIAGCNAKAVTYLLQAGERARRLYANEEALVTLGRALTLLQTAPQDESQLHWQQHVAARYAVLLASEQVYGLQGEHAARLANLAALEDLAQAMGDRARQAEVALRWSWYYEQTSDYRALIEAARRALELASGDPSHEAAARLRWGRGLLLQADYAAAQAQLMVALELAQAAGVQQVELEALRYLGIVASDQSDYRAARASYEQALAITHTIGDRQAETKILTNLGTVALEQGDYRVARASYEDALAIARTIADQSMQGVVLGHMGEVARAQGDYVAARAHSEQAAAYARALGDRQGEGWALSNLGEVAWAQSDYLAARAYAEQAVAIARAIGNQFFAGWALTGLGHALTSLGLLADAIAAFGEAAELHHTIGQAYLAAGSRSGLARAQLAHGDLAGAQAQVEQVLAYLATGSLNAAGEPIRAYVCCVEVLQAARDTRARALLARGYGELQAQAARMDESARRLFLDNVPHHRALIRAWEEDRQA